jgi:hypothetical protein
VLLTALLAGRAQAQVTNQTDVKTWRIWEGVFRTSNTYTNPSYDVQLKVIFTPPAGSGLSPITAYGFWDGIESSQSVFKVRTAFPTAPGASPWVWTWTSSCTGGGCNTDAVLNQSTPFSVNVTPSTGGHVLFSHGFLKVNTSGVNANRYLVNDDGTPFFWLGDTAWNASIRAISAASGATALDWENYVLDRKAKGFTVVQIALPVDYMDSKNDGITQPKDFQTPRQMPFTQGSGCGTAPIPNSCSQWNPEYWKNFEQKVRYANGQGLVVLVVGLAERIIESNPTYPTNADLLVNARNVVARLSGEFVVFSPGFDRLPGTGTGCTTSENDMTCRIKVVGQKIKDTSTRHMVVNHFGGSLAVTGMDPFIDEPWLDFQLFQSGSACSDATSEANQTTLITQRARTFALHLWNLTTSTGGHKPVVNGEAIYAGNMCKGKPWTVNFTAYRVRQTGYLSMLSGAVGYTFGVIGVFDWGLNGSIPWGPPTTPPPTPPTKGTDFPSNAQMQVMCKVFRSLPAWQQLMPDHNLIANNTTPGTPPPPLPDELLMVLARDVNNQFAVAYLPNNAAIKIETAGFSNFASWTKEWVDPRNGAISTATCLKQGISTIYRCDVPSTTVPGETADWVLRLGASPFTATTLCN